MHTLNAFDFIDYRTHSHKHSPFILKQKAGFLIKESRFLLFHEVTFYSTPLHLLIQAIISRRVLAFNE